MSRYWCELVRSLTPYVPGEQPKVSSLVKLNTNENPYGPSPEVIEALKAEADDRLRLYPDPESVELKNTLASYYQVKPEQVFVGNGSDEVLAHTFQALLKHDKPLLFPDISYSFYPVYSKLYAIDFETVPLDENFKIDFSNYPAENGGVIFPNPNAPTGLLKPLVEIEAFLQINRDSVVVVDEAYVDFGGESAISLVDRYPNLLVIQTVSKSRSLAGLRVGFAIGDEALIEALQRVKNSFNSYPMDRFATAGAIAAFRDENYFRQSCDKIINSRDWLSQQLTQLGFDVLPSTANFIFVEHGSMKAEAIALKLREKNIIVRYFNLPRIDNHLRITVGTQQECELLVGALKNIL